MRFKVILGFSAQQLLRILCYTLTLTICFFWTCLYPHSHLNPIIFPLRVIFSHFLALHPVFCLWNFHNISASFGESAIERFADRRNHAMQKPRLNQIAGTSTPELSSVSRNCVNIVSMALYPCINNGYIKFYFPI